MTAVVGVAFAGVVAQRNIDALVLCQSARGCGRVGSGRGAVYSCKWWRVVCAAVSLVSFWSETHVCACVCVCMCVGQCCELDANYVPALRDYALFLRKSGRVALAEQFEGRMRRVITANLQRDFRVTIPDEVRSTVNTAPPPLPSSGEATSAPSAAPGAATPTNVDARK